MRVARLRPIRLSLFAVWFVAANVSPTVAQVAAGEITGVVRDQAGASVPGAIVTVTHVDTNRQRIVPTSGEGVYSAPSLAPGAYRVDVELAGFKPVRRDGIHLSTGERARIDFALAVGSVSERVTVTADAAMLRAETASLGTVVEHEQVVRLPLNGRTFITLASLAPGVALPPNSQLPRINGGRPRTNEYLFDGISVLQPEPGQVAFFPVIDAIQEFKIESNSPPAEFGRFNGGVIADSVTWLKGRHTLKMGLDWRWERLNVIQPPFPTGSFTFSNLFTNLPATPADAADTGTPLASFLLGQVQTFSIDLQQSTDLPAGAGRARQLHGVLGAIANDWTVASLVTLQSGVPVGVTQTTNNNAFAGFGVQRPNLVGDPTLGADQRTPSHWFNTAAFVPAPQFTIGSASRNPVRGPSYRNVDLALMRRIPLRATQAIELRAEVFNLLNTPNFGAPNAVAGVAGFGTITTAIGAEAPVLSGLVSHRPQSAPCDSDDADPARGGTPVGGLARAVAQARSMGRRRARCAAAGVAADGARILCARRARTAESDRPGVRSHHRKHHCLFVSRTAGRVSAVQSAVRGSAVRRGLCGRGSHADRDGVVSRRITSTDVHSYRRPARQARYHRGRGLELRAYCRRVRGGADGRRQPPWDDAHGLHLDLR
jgi:hypothetical protein